MTAKIVLSAINSLPFDFDDAVDAFRQAKLAHRFTVDEPAPTAHELVESAVRRVPSTEEGQPDDFIVDYEVVDDSPPPPTLAERKTALVMKLRQAEAAANALAFPSGKQRLATMEHSRIVSKPVNERAPEDIARLADIEAKYKALEGVQFKGATIEADIDDVTEATIDAAEAKYSGDLSRLFA